MALDILGNSASQNPLKMLVYFAVGIIVPCIFLSSLGVRSYRYEKRLLQKEAEERYAVVANLIESRIKDNLTTLLSSAQGITRQAAFQPPSYTHSIPVLLGRPEIDHLRLEGLFVFDDEERMVAPWAEVSKQSQSLPVRRDLDWGRITQDVERLEHLEFVENRVAAALKGYKALQSPDLAPSIQAGLLKAIAGDYRNLNQNRLAAMTYLQLATRYEQVQDFSGYPMGVIGRQEAIKIDTQDKRQKEALSIRLDLFEGILLRRWNLTDKQMGILLTQLREAINHTVAMKSEELSEQNLRWNRLQSMQKELKTLEDAGEQFAKLEWPSILRHFRELGSPNQGAVIELAAAHAPKIAIIVPIRVVATDRQRGLLVATLPVGSVWARLGEVMTTLASSSGLKIEWMHGSAQQPPSALWKSGVEREVRLIDPPLRFSLREADTSARMELFRRRQWIFSGMIGVSLIVILAGTGMTFYAVKREVEVANLKSDFVAIVSHELRTPLTAIWNIGERLARGRYDSGEEREQFYGLLSQEAVRLRTLIEDILDFSKILAGKKLYNRDPVDLVALVQESIESFEPKAESHGFEIVETLPAQPIHLLGDTRALRQTVLNLLDNAMKYSGKSRKIDVCVSATAKEATLMVKDYGIGIDDRDKQKIFEKFYRSESNAQGNKEGGVGLGLALVKHVVNGHHGTIEIASRLGQGSAFFLRFPLVHVEPL